VHTYRNDSLFVFPCLDDNYGFIYQHTPSSLLLVDSPDGERYNSVIEHLKAKNDEDTPIDKITLLNTHHHADHTRGNAEILAKNPRTLVFSPQDDIPGTTNTLWSSNFSRFPLTPFTPEGQPTISPMDTSGHTERHISYYIPSLNLFFAGDALFSGGCGRIFEGTHQQSFVGLYNIKAHVDPDAWVLCAHEYTQSNLKFIKSLEEYAADEHVAAREAEVAALREQGLPTIPVTLGSEMDTNAFLKAQNVKEFTRVREMKDNF
jgi:hydroxyacylglutathione hydrolase